MREGVFCDAFEILYVFLCFIWPVEKTEGSRARKRPVKRFGQSDPCQPIFCCLAFAGWCLGNAGAAVGGTTMSWQCALVLQQQAQQNRASAFRLAMLVMQLHAQKGSFQWHTRKRFISARNSDPAFVAFCLQEVSLLTVKLPNRAPFIPGQLVRHLDFQSLGGKHDLSH